LENVKQLTTHDQGRTFAVILRSLENLGYYVHYKVLNGLDFGVPQKRERIMIVGFLENHPFEFPEKSKRRPKKLADILEHDGSVDSRHFLSRYFKEKLRKKLIEQGKVRPESPTVWHENMSGNISMKSYSCALRANGSFNYLLVNGERRLTPREMFRLQGFPDSYEIIVPDSQARKQAGNAVVVPQMEAMARAIVEALSKDPLQELRKGTGPIVKGEYFSFLR
jgi:DNA (cytosine-5)-methyltransferase 1